MRHRILILPSRYVLNAAPLWSKILGAEARDLYFPQRNQRPYTPLKYAGETQRREGLRALGSVSWLMALLDTDTCLHRVRPTDDWYLGIVIRDL